MRILFSCTFAALAVVALVATAVSLTPSDEWFVRAIDLIREPLTYASIALAVAACFAVRRARWLVVGAFLVVAATNVLRIWPYVPFAPAEIALGDRAVNAECFIALAVNVKVKNRDHEAIIAQIGAVQPDLLFLMETDQTWADALEPVLSTYPHSLADIQPHAFGMIFASRLPVIDAEMIENTTRDTPTLYATIDLPNARPFGFVGLHPKPPILGMDTTERDANIIRAGQAVPSDLPNAVVMGDFNDVPWSRTTTRFREAGDWRDPRIGRGTYPTFPASMLWFGWPLDQLMVKGDMTVQTFEIMPRNSSDHRAVRAEMCLAPEHDSASVGPSRSPK